MSKKPSKELEAIGGGVNCPACGHRARCDSCDSLRAALAKSREQGSSLSGRLTYALDALAKAEEALEKISRLPPNSTKIGVIVNATLATIRSEVKPAPLSPEKTPQCTGIVVHDEFTVCPMHDAPRVPEQEPACIICGDNGWVTDVSGDTAYDKPCTACPGKPLSTLAPDAILDSIPEWRWCDVNDGYNENKLYARLRIIGHVMRAVKP